MKKILALTVLTLPLLACAPNTAGNTYDVTAAFTMPPEMANCHIYRMTTPQSVPNVIAVFCPDATVSANYQDGKVQAETVTINGKVYAPVEESPAPKEEEKVQ